MSPYSKIIFEMLNISCLFFLCITLIVLVEDRTADIVTDTDLGCPSVLNVVATLTKAVLLSRTL